MPDTPTPGEIASEHTLAAWLALGHPAPPGSWQQGWYCLRCTQVHKETTRQCPQR